MALNGLSSSTTSTGMEMSSSSWEYWKLILILGSINFLDAIVYSLPAAFYPKEAESKGLSKTEYGLVFGSFELTSFIVCPIIGNFMYKTSPRSVYHVGVIIAGTSVTLFGFLDRVNSHIPFLIFSFVLRILESVGSGLLFVSSYTIVTNYAPSSVAKTFATMEVMFGMGFSTGPIVGEALYVIGGFKLPFFVLGGSLFLTGVLTYFFFEVSSNDDNDNIVSKRSIQTKKGYVELFGLPLIALQAFGIIVGAVSISFLYASLEPHLRQFALKPMAIGLIFFINGATYAFCSPIFGKISDYVSEPARLTLFGSSVAFIAFLLIGPAPFFPIAPSMDLVITGLVLMGIGLPAIYVSCFTKALGVANDHAFLDSNALVSSMWMSCMSFGSFIGPSAAGFLSDQCGFRNATYFIMLLNFTLMSFIIGYIIKRRRSLRASREHDERSALLRATFA